MFLNFKRLEQAKKSPFNNKNWFKKFKLGIMLGDIPERGAFPIWNAIGEKVGEEIGEGLVILPKLYFFALPWIGLEENCPYDKNKYITNTQFSSSTFIFIFKTHL